MFEKYLTGCLQELQGTGLVLKISVSKKVNTYISCLSGKGHNQGFTKVNHTGYDIFPNFHLITFITITRMAN